VQWACLSLTSWALLAAILLVPPVSVVGVSIWARRMSRRPEVPRFVSWVAYVFAVPAALAIVFGTGCGVVTSLGAGSGESTEPSQKARALAEGISEFMNCGALGFLIAIVTALWLLFCTWRWRRRSAPPSKSE